MSVAFVNWRMCVVHYASMPATARLSIWRYLRNAVREFLQTCHKRPISLKDELIIFWWSMVTITVTPQNTFLAVTPCKNRTQESVFINFYLLSHQLYMEHKIWVLSTVWFFYCYYRSFHTTRLSKGNKIYGIYSNYDEKTYLKCRRLWKVLTISLCCL